MEKGVGFTNGATFLSQASFFPCACSGKGSTSATVMEARNRIGIEKKVKPDIVFTTSGPAYWRPKAPHVVGYNLGHYVYPDSPFWSTLPLSRQIKWKFKKLVIQYFFLNRDYRKLYRTFKKISSSSRTAPQMLSLLVHA